MMLNTRTGNCRVLFVLGGFKLGGTERQCIQLAHCVRRSGAHVEILAFDGTGKARTIFEEAGFPCHDKQFQWNASVFHLVPEFVKYYKRLKELRPDVILSFTNPPNVVCGILWRFVHARGCIWNQRDQGYFRMRRWMERLALYSVSDIFSNSNAGAEFLKNEYAIHEGRISVIPNGICLDSPKATKSMWRIRLRTSGKQAVCCMIAHLTHRNDHHAVLSAWKRVTKEIDAVLVLAGSHGDRYKSVCADIVEMGLQEKVRVIGEIDDVSGLVAASDLGIFSSVKEGMPNGVLECMAGGLAVVGFDTPGVKEALGAQSTISLAPNKNEWVFARRVVKFLLDGELRKRVGKENQQRIKQHFGVERLCERTLSRLEQYRDTEG